MLEWKDKNAKSVKLATKNMDIQQVTLSIGGSIIIGALIGLEREKTTQSTKGISAVGIRTDILISLFGAISVLLGQLVNPALFMICLCAMLILTIASYIYISITKNRVGITTEISTILVFLLGALAMLGYIQIAIGLAIIITLILSLREYLHRAIININYNEIYDTIKFAIIAFIILPFLPNYNFDDQFFQFFFPTNNLPISLHQVAILNPYRIWFLVVLVSGISFLGYILVKIIGKKKGIGISGLIGGLYSSTATSLSLARKSKLYQTIQTPFITGIVLACGISFVRTFIELRALNEELFSRTFIPIMMMFAYLMIVGLYLLFKKSSADIVPKKVDHESDFKTPFELKEGLKLGAFITIALLGAKIILSFTNVKIYYLVAALMAFFAIDDPILISTATNAGKLLSMEEAKNVIILILTLNMIQKVFVIYLFGNRKLVIPMAKIFGGLCLVSLLGFIYF